VLLHAQSLSSNGKDAMTHKLPVLIYRSISAYHNSTIMSLHGLVLYLGSMGDIKLVGSWDTLMSG
jgi:hypothetical protein